MTSLRHAEDLLSRQFSRVTLTDVSTAAARDEPSPEAQTAPTLAGPTRLTTAEPDHEHPAATPTISTVHYRAGAPDRHACLVCGKVFTRKHNLKQHVSSVHETIRLHECTFDGCGRKYARRLDLGRRMMRAHPVPADAAPYLGSGEFSHNTSTTARSR
ncbi:hypothetical protein BV20DRAFT_966356 [Pilatotrama ljubarskyi]|nr:hypothetical protein BV20DRAFT_966356 [Pilatotrama ljubarskyi]